MLIVSTRGSQAMTLFRVECVADDTHCVTDAEV
jgi:hypothetical protein